MSSNKILATFRISPSDWEAFRNKASQENTTASALLLKFVLGYLGGDCTEDEDISDSTREYIERCVYINLDKLTVNLEQDIYNRIDQQKSSLEQYLDTSLDKQKIHLEKYIDKCIESKLKRLREIENTLNEVLPRLRSRLDADNQENVLASIYANLDNNIDLTKLPFQDANSDEDRTFNLDKNLDNNIDSQEEEQAPIPETTDISEENMIKFPISKLDNNIDNCIDNDEQTLESNIDSEIDSSLDSEKNLENSIDIGIDGGITDSSIDSNLDTETETKTYEDAIAIIKQMVLRDRRPQKEVIAFLNSEGYPTATGVGAWTAAKVSKEASKLKNSRRH